MSGRLLPDAGVAVLAADRVADGTDEPEAARVLRVELALVRLGRQAMLRRPRRSGITVPDAGETLTACILVGGHAAQPETLSREIIEQRLVFGPGQPVPRDPLQALLLFPYRAEQDLPSGTEYREINRPKALAAERRDRRLILSVRDAVARPPVAAALVVPDAGEARSAAERVARDLDYPVTAISQLVELCLMVGGSEAVPCLPVRHDHVPAPGPCLPPGARSSMLCPLYSWRCGSMSKGPLVLLHSHLRPTPTSESLQQA